MALNYRYSAAIKALVGPTPVGAGCEVLVKCDSSRTSAVRAGLVLCAEPDCVDVMYHSDEVEPDPYHHSCHHHFPAIRWYPAPNPAASLNLNRLASFWGCSPKAEEEGVPLARIIKVSGPKGCQTDGRV